MALLNLYREIQDSRFGGFRGCTFSVETITPAMAVSTEIATPPKTSKSKKSNSSVQSQMKQKSPFEFVLQNTEKSQSLDLMDFGEVKISGETVI